MLRSSLFILISAPVFLVVGISVNIVCMVEGIFLTHQIKITVVLSHIPTALGKDKNEQPHVSRTSIHDVIVMLKLRHHVASAHSGFSGSLFHVFPI